MGQELLRTALGGTSNLPNSLKDLAIKSGQELIGSSKGYISSSIDVLSRNVADTYNNIFSGSNITSSSTKAANDTVKLYTELL
jgi:hypothetical protein